jgi:hypothetical protein
MTKKIVIWGYPPHTHTHSYIHLGFAKAFSYLDYDVVWYDDSEEYSQEDLSDAIIISENNCRRHLPIVDSSKYFIHNIEDGFHSQNKIEHDNVYNLLVYHEQYNWNDDVKNIDEYSWYHPDTKTAVIMWGTDLLPDEIDSQDQVLFDNTKDTVNYIGSLSGEYIQKITSVVDSNGKQFVNYGGYSGIRSRKNNGFMDDNQNIDLTKKSYLNFDLRPPQHLDNGYIPCRIFKALSYGCWIGTNSIKMNKFFDGRITTNEDLNNLYTETEEASKNATKEVLKDNQEFIKENHTYLNRVQSLLSIL